MEGVREIAIILYLNNYLKLIDLLNDEIKIITISEKIHLSF